MLKALCLFAVITIIIQNVESVPTVLVANLTSFKIEPNNNVIADKGNRLIEWQKKVQEGADGIQIYDVDQKDGEDYDLEDLCKNPPQTIFPKIIKGLLGIHSCPVEKSTLSLMTNEFSEPKQLSERCSPDESLTFKLKSKKDKKLIMTLNITYKTLRLQKCKS